MRSQREERVLRQLLPAIRWLTTVANEAEAMKDQTAAEILHQAVYDLQNLADTGLAPIKLRQLTSSTVRI